MCDHPDVQTLLAMVGHNGAGRQSEINMSGTAQYRDCIIDETALGETEHKPAGRFAREPKANKKNFKAGVSRAGART